MPFIKAMEEFSNAGGMITEQLWDAADLPDLQRGKPTGAAMPLCWSHAEYIALVRSRHDGVCFDRVESAFQRYVVNPVQSRHEIWGFRHQRRRMRQGTIFRIVVAAKATIVWSPDNWATTNKSDTTGCQGLDLWFADLPTKAFQTVPLSNSHFSGLTLSDGREGTGRSPSNSADRDRRYR